MLWIYIPLCFQVDIIHRRLHKDILHNPVVMLNFCPDLKSISSDLRKVHGEFIFLIDRSGSMSGVNINRVKVYLKGQFTPKSKIHIFPLTCSAIYQSRLFWCELAISQI